MAAQTIPAQAQQTLPAQMYDVLNAHMLVQAPHVAATLRIADFLAGSSAVESWRTSKFVRSPSFYRLLRMLAGAGVFAEEASGQFKLTPLGSTLRTDRPDSVRDWALFIAAPPVWAAWSNLLHSVQTSESAFEHTFGMRVSATWPTTRNLVEPTTPGWPNNRPYRTEPFWQATTFHDNPKLWMLEAGKAPQSQRFCKLTRGPREFCSTFSKWSVDRQVLLALGAGLVVEQVQLRDEIVHLTVRCEGAGAICARCGAWSEAFHSSYERGLATTRQPPLQASGDADQPNNIAPPGASSS